MINLLKNHIKLKIKYLHMKKITVCWRVILLPINRKKITFSLKKKKISEVFVSVILPDYWLAREAEYTTTFSRMDNPLEGPSRRFDAATVVSTIESGLLSADDSSSSSEDDYFDLSDPEATIYDHNFILLNFLAQKRSEICGYRVNV